MRLARILLTLTIVVSDIAARGETNQAAIEQVRRLYDLTPVSATNPVIASVKECQIEIPVSELRAYLSQDTPPNKQGKLTLAEKRQELEKLLDDYFWVWEGYSKHADETSDIAGMLKITQDDAMRAMLIQEEADSKASSYEEYQKLSRDFRRRIMDKADFHVSAKAYDVLKTAAKRVDETDRAAGTNAIETSSLTDDGLKTEDRNLTLVTCKAGTVQVGALLRAYRQFPVDQRPNLEKPEAFNKILEELFGEGLLLAEARDRGLDKAEAVRTQVQADRTGLVRQWALEQITRKADDAVNAPGLDKRLEDWYQAHLKSLYTVKDEEGKERVLTLKADRDLIQSDYFNDTVARLRAEELRRLRQGRKIEIDEKLLEQVTLSWWAPTKVAELDSSLISWNGDSRDYVVKGGETNATFSFSLTNVCAYDVVIEDVHPINEFISVKSPNLPWTVKPGDHGTISLDVDLRSKYGVGHSPVVVQADLGNKTLVLNITYPPAPKDPVGKTP